MGVGPSWPGMGYNLLVCHLLRPLEKCSIRVGVTQFSRCRLSQLPLARKGNSLIPCTSSPCFGSCSVGCTHCLTSPSEMNLVTQLEIQKSPVFCVAHTGSGRLQVLLFGHLGTSPTVSLCVYVYSYYSCFFPSKTEWCYLCRSVTFKNASPYLQEGIMLLGKKFLIN